MLQIKPRFGGVFPARIFRAVHHLLQKIPGRSGSKKELNCVPMLPGLMRKGVYLSYTQYYRALGLPWENRGLYDKMSPLLSAGNAMTPTLFLGRREDWNVPILDSELSYQALKMKVVDT